MDKDPGCVTVFLVLCSMGSLGPGYLGVKVNILVNIISLVRILLKRHFFLSLVAESASSFVLCACVYILYDMAE